MTLPASALEDSKETIETFRPRLVGVLNVTPDSFYDGGRYIDPSAAVSRGLEMFGQGAAWVDVGGMSTRPGSSEIPVEAEMERIVPVIARLFQEIGSGGERLISVDTYRVRVAERAVAAGASCVNDVSGFTLDPEMCRFCAASAVRVVINHMKGTPENMQADPRYGSIWEELTGFFERRMDDFVRAGGRESNIILDPGIGFGKTLDHNLDILRGIEHLRDLGRPILLGCSRKSFIEKLNPGVPPSGRLPGSLAAAAWAALKGVDYLRVHDVAETAQFLNVFSALKNTPDMDVQAPNATGMSRQGVRR